MPNVDNIFDLFNDGDNKNDKSPPPVLLTEDSCEFNLGMFTKLIQNNIVFNQKINKFFKKIEREYEEEETKKASEFTTFNRAWNYVRRVDIEDPELVAIIINYDISLLKDSLERAIQYFEDSEQYERCAHMHKIYKLVKSV